MVFSSCDRVDLVIVVFVGSIDAVVVIVVFVAKANDFSEKHNDGIRSDRGPFQMWEVQTRRHFLSVFRSEFPLVADDVVFVANDEFREEWKTAFVVQLTNERFGDV